ncbi:tripartite tricarboxylate transporter permease [Nesterenkonia natronophila]|uniref:Tat pathway signal protein n=1 Tax=Nesterenkonia natronophila TaxID=2174932 RepID=A0A3A4F2B7_9MICC|nr:tripartite tricarboxylate transporter permease [Nesterenkonia natronophila]RJN31976.1 Tat pathway signal protein [Nesterenkonia natronophila]
MDFFILSALDEVFTLPVLLTMLVGTMFGITAGIIPGFTVTMGVVLAFPFTFGMDPVQGIALMISVLVGGYSGGVVSSVLLGIPGTASSIATTFDGYPLAIRGEPGRALGLGIISSFFGNIIGLAILVFLAPLIARFSLNFGPWEITLVILLALGLVGSLSHGALVLGWISAGLGLLVATVGISPTGSVRFDFGFPQMTGGFELLPVLVGAFAFSQLLTRFDKNETEANGGVAEVPEEVDRKIKIPYVQVVKDIIGQKMNVLRSSVIGSSIGALPAVGATTSTFIAYDQARRTSKDPESFGKGNPRGLVAAETSNNATLSGVLVPTLTLGIPGDITMAIMFGVLMMYGLQPGPALFAEQPVLMGSIYLGLFISGIMMILLMLFLARYLVKIAGMPVWTIVPIVLMLSTVGTFALNNRMFDVWSMLAFGIMGYYMTRIGVPLTPFVLGVILGPVLELNLVRSVELDPTFASYVTRPISLSILVVALVVVLIYVLRQRKRPHTPQPT